MSTFVATQPEVQLAYRDEGEWTSGICDCCQDKRDCCFTCWCCPCVACRTSKSFGQCLCLPLLDICGFAHPITMSFRLSVRRRYGIGGSLCRDCMFSAFCLPCVWCQMSREMKLRELPVVLGDIVSH